MNDSRKFKLWLAFEFTIAVVFYRLAYAIISNMLSSTESWMEMYTRFRVFCVTWVFLYATIRLINFIMSWIKKERNAFLNCFTNGWFSVHKLFKKQETGGIENDIRNMEES